MAVAEICRKLGVAEATFYNWKKKYGGLGPSELKRLRQLEEGESAAEAAGRRAEPGQGHVAGGGQKSSESHSEARLNGSAAGSFGVSERRACKIMSISRSSLTYGAKARNCSALRKRIREIAASRIHYGGEWVRIVLRREAHLANKLTIAGQQ